MQRENIENSSVTLEKLSIGTIVQGLSGEGSSKIIQVEWFGDQALKVIFEDSKGVLRNQLLYRSDEARLKIGERRRAWSFSADGELFRLVSEAHRIRLAYLFDPYLAIHTSLVEPLPHQITAVYGEMLPRQPLRFLLADDPGAGKTVMAGLLLKELLVRGDLERCLIVAPGNLVEQWQDELYSKFDLNFDILSRDQIESSRTSNPFLEHNLLIARLDMLSRNLDLQAKFKASPRWDLIICDEAHKMSASYFGGEVKYTKRYNLGRELGEHSRNFLLMSATPHNGKDADFQLFMGLLDADRFEGKFREGVHKPDVTDLMRRLTKEELYRFDGRKLFPERISQTVTYTLSDGEAALYHDVTEYVRNEMNRADRFVEDQQRRVNVGFALQILQRRLASSPEAIYQSIIRRKERLENKLAETRLLKRGSEIIASQIPAPKLSQENLDDLDDYPEDEVEEIEQELTDQATAARSIEELELEIQTLQGLERSARQVRLSGMDAKWVQLSEILDDPLVRDENGNRRKLVIFTEFRDTLNYLATKIRNRLGKSEAVVVVHGGIAREERRSVIEAFRQDKNVLVMLANDALGEGVNLQRAHLMVNYDLPWNPNRIEQRFGRIHRIGQEEVCRLWNLVAAETREGEVYYTLLHKLEEEREALGGRVYDVLGKLFEDTSLRDLLVEAVRYGDQPATKEKLQQVIDNAVDKTRLVELLEDSALAHDTMDATKVQRIRDDIERANARRLQPHFIKSFFIDAFERLGGKIVGRESGRFEVKRVPAEVRDRDRQIGVGDPVQPRYERICFDKEKINQSPVAAFITPGHPLLDCTTDLTLEKHRDLLKIGALLVDDSEESDELRILVYLQHSIQDGKKGKNDRENVISEQLQFIEIRQNGDIVNAGPAPYLDYRPLHQAESEFCLNAIDSIPWLSDDFEQKALSFAISSVVPTHLDEVRKRRLPMIDKIRKEVTSRLRKEINHWDHRAEELRLSERSGKTFKLNSANASALAEQLADRLQKRLLELDLESEISALPPVVKGAALIVSKGFLQKHGLDLPQDDTEDGSDYGPLGRQIVEKAAMDAVLRTELALGRVPCDVHLQKGLGYDIESKDPMTGELYFIEVKGRWHLKDVVTLTKNEILCARNQPEKFRLVLVLVDENGAKEPIYLTEFKFGEPDFAETMRSFNIKKLLESSVTPR